MKYIISISIFIIIMTGIISYKNGKENGAVEQLQKIESNTCKYVYIDIHGTAHADKDCIELMRISKDSCQSGVEFVPFKEAINHKLCYRCFNDMLKEKLDSISGNSKKIGWKIGW